MVTRRKTAAPRSPAPLDTEPYLGMVRQARQSAKEALAEYGEPRVSLPELRQALDGLLAGQSLSEWLVREREASL